MVSGSICRDSRTAESVRIFEGGRSYKRNWSEYLKRDAEIRGPLNRSEFLNGDAGIYDSWILTVRGFMHTLLKFQKFRTGLKILILEKVFLALC